MPQVAMAENKGVVQAQEARETLTSCLMYLYHAHLNQGLNEVQAKEAVAQEIGGLLEHWSTLTGLTFKASVAMNPLKVLDGLIETTRQEAARAPVPQSRVKWQQINRQLVDLKQLAKKEGS